MAMVIPRPAPDEYHPLYAGYIGLLPGEVDPRDVLRDQLNSVPGLLITVSEDGASHRYAPGKWSIKEVVGHLCDTERILTYRLLRVIRADRTPLPGFEENDYVAAAGFDDRELGDLVSEWEAVRHATLALVESISPDTLVNSTTANDAVITARALLYIVAGHTQHHLEILRARYGVGTP